MKKIILTLAIALVIIFLGNAPSLAESNELIVKIGTDINGSASLKSMEISADFNTETGLAIEADYYFFPISERAKIGCGIEYQLIRKLVNAEDMIQYIPIYGMGRMSLSDSDSFNFYVIGRIGYNLFNYDFPPEIKEYYKAIGMLFSSKGGIHYGAGCGVHVHDSLVIELIYSMYNGTINTTYEDYGLTIGLDCNYSKIGLTIGYKIKN